MESLLYMLGLLVLLGTPLMWFRSTSDAQRERKRQPFALLNALVLLGSLFPFFEAFTGDPNPMFLLAVFVPFVFVVVSAINLGVFLKRKREKSSTKSRGDA